MDCHFVRYLYIPILIFSSKPKVVKKNKMIPAILQVLFPMCADPSDEESETEELTNHKVFFFTSNALLIKVCCPNG